MRRADNGIGRRIAVPEDLTASETAAIDLIRQAPTVASAAHVAVMLSIEGTDTTADEVFSRLRKRRVVRHRHRAIWLVRQAGWSFPQIAADGFDVDTMTVQYATRRHAFRRKAAPGFRELACLTRKGPEPTVEPG